MAPGSPVLAHQEQLVRPSSFLSLQVLPCRMQVLLVHVRVLHVNVKPCLQLPISCVQKTLFNLITALARGRPHFTVRAESVLIHAAASACAMSLLKGGPLTLTPSGSSFIACFRTFSVVIAVIGLESHAGRQ